MRRARKGGAISECLGVCESWVVVEALSDALGLAGYKVWVSECAVVGGGVRFL